MGSGSASLAARGKCACGNAAQSATSGWCGCSPPEQRSVWNDAVGKAVAEGSGRVEGGGTRAPMEGNVLSTLSTQTAATRFGCGRRALMRFK